MAAFGPLGSWPLACWINECSFPRVDGSTLCVKHGFVDAPPRVVAVERFGRQRAHGELQRELLGLLRSAGAPMRSTELARAHSVDPSLASKTLAVLVDKGLARKLSLGTYAAVSS